jgi:hypothetical protein
MCQLFSIHVHALLAAAMYSQPLFSARVFTGGGPLISHLWQPNPDGGIRPATRVRSNYRHLSCDKQQKTFWKADAAFDGFGIASAPGPSGKWQAPSCRNSLLWLTDIAKSTGIAT